MGFLIQWGFQKGVNSRTCMADSTGSTSPMPSNANAKLPKTSGSLLGNSEGRTLTHSLRPQPSGSSPPPLHGKVPVSSSTPYGSARSPLQARAR
jgi:hypothetical protein